MMTSHRSDACFKAEYFDDIYEFETSNFWFQNRNELIIWALATYFPTIDSFLEIGCGTGFVLSEIEKSMPDLSLTGIDLFAEGLLKARQRVKRAALIEQDARQLTLDADFDVSGAFDVLEHIDEDELVLRELFRVCRQGLLITVPQHEFLWSAVDEYSCHKRR